MLDFSQLKMLAFVCPKGKTGVGSTRPFHKLCFQLHCRWLTDKQVLDEVLQKVPKAVHRGTRRTSLVADSESTRSSAWSKHGNESAILYDSKVENHQVLILLGVISLDQLFSSIDTLRNLGTRGSLFEASKVPVWHGMEAWNSMTWDLILLYLPAFCWCWLRRGIHVLVKTQARDSRTKNQQLSHRGVENLFADSWLMLDFGNEVWWSPNTAVSLGLTRDSSPNVNRNRENLSTFLEKLSAT